MSISDTIKKLRTDNALTQVELAEKLNCNRQKIADWERGKSTPSADDIILLCEKFGVSADYILGLSGTPTSDKDLQFVCDYLGLTEKSCRLIRAFLGEDVLMIRQPFNYLIEEEVFTDLACRLDKFAERFKVIGCVTGRVEKRKAYDQSQLELFYAQEMLKDSFKKYIKDGATNGNDQQA